MKIRVWSWAFYQGYFWLILGLMSLFGLTVDELLNEPGLVTGVFIGYGFMIWLLFTIGRLIYVKVYGKGSNEGNDEKSKESPSFNEIERDLKNLYDVKAKEVKK